MPEHRHEKFHVIPRLRTPPQHRRLHHLWVCAPHAHDINAERFFHPTNRIASLIKLTDLFVLRCSPLYLAAHKQSTVVFVHVCVHTHKCRQLRSVCFLRTQNADGYEYQ